MMTRTVALLAAIGLAATAGAGTVAEWTFDAKGAPQATGGGLTLVWQTNGTYSCAALRVSDRALGPAEFLNRGKPAAGMPPPPSVPGILYPDLEFARLPFNNPGTVEVGCGYLGRATPVDADGDGDWDIIAGNSGGYIVFIENLSGPGVEYPRWAEPKLITVKHPERCKVAKWLKGNVIHSWCGDENSPQGPAEAKWGYTVCSVADWDGDGYLDIIANDVKGSVVFIRNPGRKGTTVMEVPRAVEVEWNGKQPTFEWEWRKPTGKVLRAPWRTTPIAYDWTGDGLVDLIMLDHEGIIVLYERAKRGGKLILKHPRRIFIDMKGNPIKLSYGPRGGNGRRKMCITDWNGDGKLDIVVGDRNAAVLINRGKTANGCTRFEQSPNVAEKQLAGHTCCPSVCDFNADGVPDLCIGAEDGHFYYFRHRKQN